MKSSSSRSLLDICVLTAGRFDLLERCLKEINSQREQLDYLTSLYVLDNGSDSEERIANNHILTQESITKTKRINPNIGFPKGANSVISMGNAPLVLFISDDIILDPGAIDILVKRMDDPTIGLCGMKFVFPRDSTEPGRPAGKVQHIGHAMNIRGEVIHPLIGWDADNPKANISRDVISVTGAAFITRRNIFEKVGGFDEAYGRGYYEDVSLCLTLKSMGLRIFIDTTAVAQHYVGATMQKRNEPVSMDLNSMLFKSKWAGTGLLVWDEVNFW